MEEKAFTLFVEAWNRIKEGYLFDESTNNTVDYMLKNLWKTKYNKIIKADILKHFPAIYAHAKYSKNPPPLFYILISLRDNDIIKEMQSLLLIDWIKSNASEDSTFQLLNFIETFSEKQIPIENFVNTIIKNMKPNFHADMLEAFAHMIVIHHPEFISNFIQKFLRFPDDTILKNFIRMTGRVGMLKLIQIAPPARLKKIVS